MKQETVELPVEILPHAAGLPLPAYMSAGAAGMDLYAAVKEAVILDPGAVQLIPTGLKAAVPAGYELQIRPRSGLAIRHGISLLNSPGTVDADYRGEIKVILINLGPSAFTVRRGDRIAQMILCPIPRIKLLPTDTLPQTVRGEGGFGHTGTK
ncbi:MAG TPA: dUTP diphosphatase [Bacillota bacterium]|nr:dUTP diphosphatase [Bacillota bacterium]HOB29385.1 dUTP diphosphatase [Bacillota bacterium]HPZ42020.1 dUTP diphosphatase [Bacillota bacterium]HQD52923.1 dUTP diphosphatase [Bacillota bacterium]